MKTHDMAPDIAVTYWKTRPVGIAQMQSEAAADFAIVGVVDVDRDPNDAHFLKTARYELPADAEKLAVCLAAIDVAYARGHLDRQQKYLDVFGFAMVDRMPMAAPARGGAR